MPGERWSPVLLLLSMTSRRIRRSQSPPWGEGKCLMMNPYLIGLGSLPSFLPQQAAWAEGLHVLNQTQPRSKARRDSRYWHL